MARINADKPHLWKADVLASVDQFNDWFMHFAPEAFRSTRGEATKRVKASLLATVDLRSLDPALLRSNPDTLSTLRMCTAPPLAVDRLVGLSNANKSLINRMEKGKLSARMKEDLLNDNLSKVCEVFRKLLDRDIFPWLDAGTAPTDHERDRAASIVADRLCSAVANPIIRNAQEQRQLALIGDWLNKRGYRKQPQTSLQLLFEMEPGTYAIRVNLPVGFSKRIISIDFAVQPMRPRRDGLPILIEVKSEGSFSQANKRKVEVANKYQEVKGTYRKPICFILFLCGYFGCDYLGFEAAEGIDWVWEHRSDDLAKLGL